MSNYTLLQQIEAFKSSKTFLDESGCFYFYDWFCSDKSLALKARSLMPKVIKFANAMNIDLRTHYVFFKNNCPMNGSLYDRFSICEIESGDVVYCVTPSCGHNHTKGQATVYGRSNDFKEPLFEASSWKNLLVA